MTTEPITGLGSIIDRLRSLQFATEACGVDAQALTDLEKIAWDLVNTLIVLKQEAKK